MKNPLPVKRGDSVVVTVGGVSTIATVVVSVAPQSHYLVVMSPEFKEPVALEWNQNTGKYQDAICGAVVQVGIPPDPSATWTNIHYVPPEEL